MQVVLNGTWKGLSSFRWENVPEFAVISGPNGCGKTQLLTAIGASLAAPPSKQRLPGGMWSEPQDAVVVDGFNCLKSQVLSLSGSAWEAQLGLGTIKYDSLVERASEITKRFAKSQAASHAPRATKGTPLDRNVAEILKRAGLPPNCSEEEFRKAISARDIAGQSFLDHSIGLSFFAYHSKLLEANRQLSDEFISLHGRKPWEIINELLSDFGLAIEFRSPESLTLFEPFECVLLERGTSNRLGYKDLSTGEKTLLNLALWLLRSYQNTSDPKLLLLDEFDGHLHPSNARRLVEVLDSVLVRKRGIRVIMTTHSPSTVALCPDESLFTMSRRPTTSITRAESKSKAIASLTSGFVVVMPGMQYVLVEDDRDVKVYGEWYSIATRNRSIPADPPLAFISAGRVGNNPSTGGKGEVSKWVSKLHGAGLDHLFSGILDRDNDLEKSTKASRLTRYSIENYLLDPLLVYVALLDADAATQIEGMPHLIGKEATIPSLGANTLQMIVDAVTADDRLVPKLAALGVGTETFSVEFPGLETLRYPAWLRDKRGKDLMHAFRESFGSSVVNHDNLLRASRKLQMVPQDLLAVFRECQGVAVPIASSEPSL